MSSQFDFTFKNRTGAVPVILDRIELESGLANELLQLSL